MYTTSHIMKRVGRQELRIDMEDWHGNKAFAVYDKFKLAGPRFGYTLTSVGNYRGNAGMITAVLRPGMLGLEVWPRSRGQILLVSASALASGCLASVLALVSIIWPRPRVERGQGRGL